MNKILKMPFGKFKGTDINDLPTWYVEFLLVKYNMNNKFFKEVFLQDKNKFIDVYHDTNYQFFHGNTDIISQTKPYKKYWKRSIYYVDYRIYYLKRNFVNFIDNNTELFKFLYNNFNMYYLKYGDKDHYINTDFIIYDSKTFLPILEVKKHKKYEKKDPNVFYYYNKMDNQVLENTFYNLIEKI
jgi:hypothetical protein